MDALLSKSTLIYTNLQGTPLIAVILATISMLAIGLFSPISKKPPESLGSYKQLFYRNLFLVMFLITLFPFMGDLSKYELIPTLKGLIISFLLFWGIYFALRSIQFGKISIVSPIMSVNNVIAVVMGFFYFNQSVTFPTLLTILIVFIGIFLLTVDVKDFKNSKAFKKGTGIRDAVLAAIFWGVITPFNSIPSKELGPYHFTLLLEIIVLLMSFIILKRKKISIALDKSQKRIFKTLLLISFLSFISSLFLNAAFATGYIVIVAVVFAVNPAVSVLYSYVFLRERLSRREYLGILMSIVGVLALSYFSSV